MNMLMDSLWCTDNEYMNEAIAGIYKVTHNQNFTLRKVPSFTTSPVMAEAMLHDNCSEPLCLQTQGVSLRFFKVTVLRLGRSMPNKQMGYTKCFVFQWTLAPL